MSMIHRSSLGAVLLFCATAVYANPADVTRLGLDELAADQPAAAIAEIMGNAELERDDPARNINLAVAHARAGHIDEARRYFDAVRLDDERVELQTATGNWIDSRELARLGLRKLARGEFQDVQATSLAAR